MSRDMSGLRGQPIRTSALLTLLRDKGSNGETMGYQLGALATCVAVFVYVSLRWRRKSPTIKDLPGPANPSWIFGMCPRANLTPLASPRMPMTLSMETFQDTSGIFRPKKLEERRGGSSRISGISFV